MRPPPLLEACIGGLLMTPVVGVTDCAPPEASSGPKSSATSLPPASPSLLQPRSIVAISESVALDAFGDNGSSSSGSRSSSMPLLPPTPSPPPPPPELLASPSPQSEGEATLANALPREVPPLLRSQPGRAPAATVGVSTGVSTYWQPQLGAKNCIVGETATLPLASWESLTTPRSCKRCCSKATAASMLGNNSVSPAAMAAGR
mmetsp:Transcript_82995/g.231609  ORF Transcript_82995/g.231609 Transcript_82995/m.231609 type:complete len:204 (+) Transcript_82995:1336-1947(+)